MMWAAMAAMRLSTHGGDCKSHSSCNAPPSQRRRHTSSLRDKPSDQHQLIPSLYRLQHHQPQPRMRQTRRGRRRRPTEVMHGRSLQLKPPRHRHRHQGPCQQQDHPPPRHHRRCPWLWTLRVLWRPTSRRQAQRMLPRHPSPSSSDNGLIESECVSVYVRAAAAAAAISTT